ncbi:hypothetical protein [Kineococcus aurantiacus]|uniref:Uncharacterized protein n=1 Tax=Kineococcus aurantiacus TaxID=37633 RepID=A0A7Y9AT34_9ACTN|nr:hypothetical protein [Kineococcus aurantiacus]NYD21575.1 hypothetical protein [Kineococcus aurantiacus]
MSNDPADQHPDQHQSLLAALRGAPAGAALPAPGPAPATVTLVTRTATSRHQAAVDAALAGGPVLVDTGAGGEGPVLLAGLLAALAATGRRVALLPGGCTAGARDELTGLGLGHLLADTPEDVARRGADLPPADPNRWLTLLRDLDTRNRAWFSSDGQVPSRFDALTGLATARAGHVHPPLVPAAAAWTAADRDRVVDLLLGGAPAGGEDPLAGAGDEEVAAAAGDLETLPGLLERTAGFADRLVGLGWRAPATVGDLVPAPALLARVEEAQRTYVPAALVTDLDQARAVLARQPRSLLSAEERERRRELKRLSALRRDGGSFGAADVEALEAVQRAWAQHAGGAPAVLPERAELAGLLESLHGAVPRVAAVLAGLPADASALAVADLGPVAERVRRAARAAHARRERAAVSAEGLEDLVAAVPAGAGREEVVRLVEATTWRAVGQAPDPGGVPVDVLAEEFGRLDDLRRARAVRELQLALSGARAHPVVVGGTAGAADAPVVDVLVVDVLVVDDAHRLPASRVAELAAGVRQVVLLGGAGDGGALEGGALEGGAADSAWLRARGLVTPVDLTLPRGRSALREAVVEALRAGGADVSAAGEAAGRAAGGAGSEGAELVVSVGGARLQLDLEDALAPWRVQDREVALPARRRAAGPHRVLRAAEWFTDHRGATRRVLEEVRALEPVAPPVPVAVVAPPPVDSFPRGLGSAEDAHRTVAEFVTALAGGNPNIDQTPPATVDAAVALAYADLGVQAPDAEVLDAAMTLLTYRRRGAKVLRAFKESVQRSKKKMRGAGVKVP